jgi:hypothetical protein
MYMSILNRLLGGGSTDDESCCDMQIEEVDSDGGEADAPEERADRAED